MDDGLGHGQLPVVSPTPPKKTSDSLVASADALQLVVGPQEPLPPCCDFQLSWSCQGLEQVTRADGWCDFRCATGTSCPQDSIAQHSSLLSSYITPFPPATMSSEPWEVGLIQMSHVGQSSRLLIVSNSNSLSINLCLHNEKFLRLLLKAAQVYRYTCHLFSFHTSPSFRTSVCLIWSVVARKLERDHCRDVLRRRDNKNIGKNGKGEYRGRKVQLDNGVVGMGRKQLTKMKCVWRSCV